MPDADPFDEILREVKRLMARRPVRSEDPDYVDPAMVRDLIARMDREDRAMMRVHVLACYDVRGYRVRGYVEVTKESDSV